MNVRGESTIHYAPGIPKDYSSIKITSANICESYLRLTYMAATDMKSDTSYFYYYFFYFFIFCFFEPSI